MMCNCVPVKSFMIAPKVFQASKKKKRRVDDAMTNNLNWVADIAVDDFTLEHISQFINLWELLQNITLITGTADTIKLPGRSPLMGNTRWPLLTKRNSPAQTNARSATWRGRLGPRQNASSLLGLWCIIGCGPRTDSPSGGGRTTRSVNYANVS